MISIDRESFVWKGVPEFNAKGISEHDQMCIILLSKVMYMDKAEIIWSNDDKRQYEFQLADRTVNKYGIMNLYIKDKELFFEDKPGLEYMHDGIWQKISFTFEILSKLNDEELMTIYTDWD